jgi:hypothetical protein
MESIVIQPKNKADVNSGLNLQKKPAQRQELLALKKLRTLRWHCLLNKGLKQKTLTVNL